MSMSVTDLRTQAIEAMSGRVEEKPAATAVLWCPFGADARPRRELGATVGLHGSD